MFGPKFHEHTYVTYKMRLLSVIRDNWKKITFGSGVCCYGLYTAKSHYDVTTHMRTVCEEVLRYSGEIGSSPKRVLVVINPVAKKKKSEKLFQKYCEPILHLAGYSVDIFKTSHVGHAKSFIEDMKVMPDAIIVAGGDGTSSEVVTGLMRKNEIACPIVLLPLGNKNETALKYIDVQSSNKIGQVKSLTSTLMPLIYQQVCTESVIKFDVLETGDGDKAQANLKPIYGLNRFSWGLLRDIESIKDKYWYFGNLRHYAAALFNSFSKNITWKLSTNFVYTPPCEGCRNCVVERAQAVPRSYLRKFLSTKAIEDNTTKNIRNNDNCSTEIAGQLETSQLNIACHRNTDAYFELQTKCISSLTPGVNFVKNVAKVTSDDIEPAIILNSRTIRLFPEASTDPNSLYSIDGEEYDVRPVKISIIPNAIRLFCDKIKQQ